MAVSWFYWWHFVWVCKKLQSSLFLSCLFPILYIVVFFSMQAFFSTSQERLGWTWTDLIGLGRIQADSEGPRLMDPNIVLNSFFIKLFHGGHQWECIQTFLLINLKKILFAALQWVAINIWLHISILCK